jgi:hypothetical protein
VERKDKDVGRKQIVRGWAEVFVFERPFMRVQKYRKAEKRAAGNNRGVWELCDGDFHNPL